MTTTGDAVARLRDGYYNADDVSVGNPGGFGGGGHEEGFFAFGADVGVVAQGVGLDAAAAVAAAASAGMARDAVAALVVSAAAANDLTVALVAGHAGTAQSAAQTAVAAAAALRSLPIRQTDGTIVHVLTTSGGGLAIRQTDGSIIVVQLT
jgi:hypothetical protein